MSTAERQVLDPEIAEAFLQEGAAVKRDGGPAPTLAEERAQQERLAPFWADGAPEVESVETLTVPGAAGPLKARLYRPTGSAGKPVVLFLHGGGWARGSIAIYEWQAQALAAWSGLPLLASSYRLAPENPYPAGLDDGVSVLRWCQEHFPSALLAGTSAGANLALAATLKVRDEGGALPAGLAFFFGVFGTDLETESYRHFGDGRFGLARQRMEMYFDLYLPPGIDRTHPSVAPVNGDLRGLPPAWLGVAQLDVLRDDSLMLAERLRAAGVRVESKIYAGLPHGFVLYARQVAKAREAIADGARFLRAVA